MSNDIYEKKAIVINLFGGPCVGKTFLSWNLAAKLRKEGIMSEIASEYVKRLIYEEREKTIQNQRYIFAKQEYSIYSLLDHNQVIITDSPILLSIIYQRGSLVESFAPFALEVFNLYNNVNYLLKRHYPYQEDARVQKTEQEGVYYDNAIKNFLDKNDIIYKEIISNDDTVDLIAKDILTKINEG
jgi:nicotinamide riboside kinase